MIAFLRGVPAMTGPDHLIIEVAGIGYKVFVPTSVLSRVSEKKEPVIVHTHMYVREDAMQLFGFLEESDRRIFELLIQVSGIGPKVGLAVLSAMSAPAFVQAVINEQLGLLTQIPGVGKKMAQRIVVELKDKFRKIELGADRTAGQFPVSATDSSAEALLALTALGYNPAEAKRALAGVFRAGQADLPLEETIRLALKELARF